jgi:hypothetical protein
VVYRNSILHKSKAVAQKNSANDDWNGRSMIEKLAREGDRFIKPDTNKIYVIEKIVLKGDWVMLKEESGIGQILTSQESLRSWIKYDKNKIPKNRWRNKISGED